MNDWERTCATFRMYLWYCWLLEPDDTWREGLNQECLDFLADWDAKWRATWPQPTGAIRPECRPWQSYLTKKELEGLRDDREAEEVAE